MLNSHSFRMPNLLINSLTHSRLTAPNDFTFFMGFCSLSLFPTLAALSALKQPPPAGFGRRTLGGRTPFRDSGTRRRWLPTALRALGAGLGFRLGLRFACAVGWPLLAGLCRPAPPAARVFTP